MWWVRPPAASAVRVPKLFTSAIGESPRRNPKPHRTTQYRAGCLRGARRDLPDVTNFVHFIHESPHTIPHCPGPNALTSLISCTCGTSLVSFRRQGGRHVDVGTSPEQNGTDSGVLGIAVPADRRGQRAGSVLQGPAPVGDRRTGQLRRCRLDA